MRNDRLKLSFETTSGVEEAVELFLETPPPLQNWFLSRQPRATARSEIVVVVSHLP